MDEDRPIDSHYTLLKCNTSTKKEVIKWIPELPLSHELLICEPFRIAACRKTRFSLSARVIDENLRVILCRAPDEADVEQVIPLFALISILDLKDQSYFTTSGILKSENGLVTLSFGMDFYLQHERNFVLEGDIQIRCTLEIAREDVKEQLLGNEGAIHELAVDLENLLDTGVGSDFKITVGEDVFPVHREILAKRSTYFEMMFRHDTIESKECRVDIKDISSQTMLHLLRFIYSGEICRLDPKELIPLYIAADRYDASKLKDACSSFLCCQLTNKVVLEVLALAHSCRDDTMKQVAFEFVLDNMQKVMQSDEWLEFKEHCPDMADFIIKCSVRDEK